MNNSVFTIQKYIPAELNELAFLFKKSNANLYIVGGFVRDFLLNLTPTDIDICSILNLNEVCILLSNSKFNIEIKNANFGTATIFVNDFRFEYTTFRKETYNLNGSHYPQKIIFTKDIKEDALRRDFYINALYYNLSNSSIEDPLGKGLNDIKHNSLSVIERNPNAFSEDACRIIRLIKFAVTKNLQIDNNTQLLAKQYFALIKNISKNRLKTELSFNTNNLSNKKKTIAFFNLFCDDLELVDYLKSLL